MIWDVRLSSRAERALARVGKPDQKRIDAALLAMREAPLSGDIIPLKGEYQGAYRRRVGSWRIIFSAKPEFQMVIVHDIRRRTSSTY